MAIQSNNSYKLRIFFLCLVAITGFIVLAPHLNYQLEMSVGDHGRDLYSFKKTLEGSTPYQDYWTQNGPLMPYYYSIFYKFFGTSIQSALLGYTTLIFFIGIAIYGICVSYLNPIISFICTIFYWSYRGEEFFYTYNHIGAVLFLLLTIHCVLLYIKNQNKCYVHLGFLSTVPILLIRPNIGVSTLSACCASLICIHLYDKDQSIKKNIIKYFFWSVSILAFSFFVYWYLTYGLADYVRSKDLAHWRYAHIDKLLDNIKYLNVIFQDFFLSTWPKRAFCFLAFLSTISAIFTWSGHSMSKEQKRPIYLVLITLFIFVLCSASEYLLGTRWWRIYWVFTPVLIILFFLIDLGLARFKNTIFLKIIILLMLLAPCISFFNTNLYITLSKKMGTQLAIGSNNITLSHTEASWIDTVTKVTSFIKHNVLKNEKIVAIPYMPLYYFLSDHDSATRELTFFGLSGEKEEDVIRQIKKSNPSLILISNRAFRLNDVKRFGIFGKDYGSNLKKYIDFNYEVVVTLGPWEKTAGWTKNHAVRIFKRKTHL